MITLFQKVNQPAESPYCTGGVIWSGYGDFVGAADEISNKRHE